MSCHSERAARKRGREPKNPCSCNFSEDNRTATGSLVEIDLPADTVEAQGCIALR